MNLEQKKEILAVEAELYFNFQERQTYTGVVET